MNASGNTAPSEIIPWDQDEPVFLFIPDPGAPQSGGFTLLELLVVVAILGLLVGLLFPALNRSRDVARQTQCMSNLKQISIALNVYLNENGEFFPRANDGFILGKAVTWGRVLQPYITHSKILLCPSKQVNGWMGDWDSDTTWAPNAYGVNEYYLFPQNPTPLVQLAKVANPSDTIAISERNAGSTVTIPAPILGGGAIGNPPCNIEPRHLNGANFLFVDGHVTWMKSRGPWAVTDEQWDLQ